jgi:hypothetical protein
MWIIYWFEIYYTGKTLQYLFMVLLSVTGRKYSPNTKNKNSMASVCEQTILTERPLSTKLVPTFADRGCREVRTTDPYGRIVIFLDQIHWIQESYVCMLNNLLKNQMLYYFECKMHILHSPPPPNWMIDVSLKFKECATFYFSFPKTLIQTCDLS